MKVLITFDTNAQVDNPFVRQLAQALQSAADCDVTCSATAFWDPAQEWDIIHIQWPEALFGWRWVGAEQVEKLEKRLIQLKEQGTGIVYTRHNTQPHHGNPLIEQGYDLVERYADAVAHMGDYSRREFMTQHPQSEQLHVIIPHHIYLNEYDTAVTQAEGRQRLGIATDRFVILAFGAFRHKAERQLVWGAFRRSHIAKRYLLAPRMFPYAYYPLWHTGLKRLCMRTAYIALRLVTACFPCRIVSKRELIPNDELPAYVAAADVLFIQRTDILNSGNVTLGFSYGKVVVGPDRGNIGEVLRLSGNPTFDPDSTESIDRALAQAARLAALGQGERNRRYANEELPPAHIAALYGATYHTLHERNTRK